MEATSAAVRTPDALKSWAHIPVDLVQARKTQTWRTVRPSQRPGGLPPQPTRSRQKNVRQNISWNSFEVHIRQTKTNKGWIPRSTLHANMTLLLMWKSKRGPMPWSTALTSSAMVHQYRVSMNKKRRTIGSTPGVHLGTTLLDTHTLRSSRIGLSHRPLQVSITCCSMNL